MNFNDQFGLAERIGQPGVVAPQALELFLLRIQPGLGATGFGRQSLPHGGIAFVPPHRQMGRVESFAPEQRSNPTGLSLGGVGFLQNAEFVLHREPPPFGVGHYLRIGWGRCIFACRSTLGGLATLDLPAFRARQKSWGRRDSILL